MAVWHPGAKRVIYSDIGPFMDVPAKIVWHTIEGNHLPRYQNSHPHFTLDPRTGDLWQHSPINRGTKTLKNLGGGVETNRAHAIQIELFGFAKDTADWPDRYYEEIADLARWIERNGNVQRRCTVDFRVTPHHRRLSGEGWLRYAGHLGHQHVPENDHWDPGAFRIDKVLSLRDDPHRRFNDSERGPDVVAFQRAVNRVARNNCRPDHRVEVDGIYGPQTEKHGAWAAWMRGVYRSQADVKKDGIGVQEQKWVRDWDELSAAQKRRARDRRRRHSRCED